MRYIEISSPGGPEVLREATGAIPVPAPGEVLIRVAAAGVNRADILQREGRYPPPPGVSPVPGLEVSGHVAALGPGAAGRWEPGEPVCALVAGGGYAEYCVAPAGQCMSIPAGVSLEHAAAIPEAAITVWANLFSPARLGPGDLLLVQGGASGIGSMAVQVARSFGCRVAVTAGTAEKRDLCLTLGAEFAANYRDSDWAAQLAAWARPRGFDAILDMVGGDYFPHHIDLLAPGGRLIHIAHIGGGRVALDLSAVMRKRLLITGSTLRSRAVSEKSALARAVEQQLWPFFGSGALRPVVHRAFPLDRAPDAHKLMESGKLMGKTILTLQP